MRIIALGIIAILTFDVFAGKPAWKLTLEERAVLRADPQRNAERHRSSVAKGRPKVNADAFMVDGSVEPASIAPIELAEQVVLVFTLDPRRREQFRAGWESRNAIAILGPNYWAKLQDLLSPAIDAERETIRMRSMTKEERDAASAKRHVKAFSDNGECQTRSAGLIAARAHWGDQTFDRFLYESVAPGVYFYTSSSSAHARSAEFWLDHWQWLERGCE